MDWLWKVQVLMRSEQNTQKVDMALIIVIVLILHMPAQPKFQAYYKAHSIQMELLDTCLNVVLISYSEPFRKNSVGIDILKQEFAAIQVFESNEEIFRFMRSEENYEYDAVNSKLVLKWKITAGSFEKDVCYRMKMIQEKLTRLEQLEVENMILKKKLEKYEAIHSLKDDSNLSTKSMDKHSHPHPYPQSNSLEKRKKGIVECIELLNSENKEESKVERNSSMEKNQGGRKKMKTAVRKVKCEEYVTEEKKRGRRKKVLKSENAAKGESTQILDSMVKITFENGDYYYGEIKNNLYHGHGLYYSSINGTFEGEWQQGRANGYGISKDLSGNQHTGYYVNDKRTGKGVDVYVNGQRYEGDFEEDEKCGKGKYWYANGDTYEGEWKNDMYHGYGKEIYQNGSAYEGTWSTDEKDGSGVFSTSDGHRWKQVWEKGIKIREEEIRTI